MKEKEIFIIMNDEDVDVIETDYIENYINNLIEQYTVIMSEDNQNVIINEEGDAFMIMEYK